MQEIELECVLVQYPNPRFKWSAKRFPDTEISTSLHQRLPTLLTSRTPYQLNYTFKVTYHPHQLSKTALITLPLKFKFAYVDRLRYENVHVKMELIHR